MVRSWYIRIATVIGVVVYDITVFLAVYLVIQGYPFEGVVVLGLAACGVPLITGWLRTELRRR